MAKMYAHKTPILASKLIEKLQFDEIVAKVQGAVDSRVFVVDAVLISNPGEVCRVGYSFDCLQRTNHNACNNLLTGIFYFTCSGVKYETLREGGKCIHFIGERLSGREIIYDKFYTEEDVLQTIHNHVRFPLNDKREYRVNLNGDNQIRAMDILESNAYFGEYDKMGRFYALSQKGDVWLFDSAHPMPENQGFLPISNAEAIMHLVQKQQNAFVIKKYFEEPF